jgi:hypothetical protein
VPRSVDLKEVSITSLNWYLSLFLQS